MNMIIFVLFEKSLPVKSEKSRKREVISYTKMTEYVDIVFSDLVNLLNNQICYINLNLMLLYLVPYVVTLIINLFSDFLN